MTPQDLAMSTFFYTIGISTAILVELGTQS
jgi:hypothetical protein